MVFLGIDPGRLGGMAALNEHGDVISVIRMPDTDAEILDYLRELWIGETATGVRATLEHVHTMPKQGIVSAFTFGAGVGALRMALCAATIPYNEVSPAVWQKSMQCLSKGLKNVTKQRALMLFPSVKITHRIADALLLAEYGRRTERRFNGEPTEV